MFSVHLEAGVIRIPELQTRTIIGMQTEEKMAQRTRTRKVRICRWLVLLTGVKCQLVMRDGTSEGLLGRI
jgi:hypothetical protein